MSQDLHTPESVPSASGQPGRSTEPLLAWPPPGLARLRGDLWEVIGRMGAGAVVFTLPLLVAITLERDPWGFGVYGDAWWIVIVTSVVGMFILLGAFVQLFRALGRWRAATGSGFAPGTVALVLSDREGDMGFLLQGERAYSVIPAPVRKGLLVARLAQGGLLLAAALWLCAGFIAGTFLAARGVLDAPGLVSWTLFPCVLAGAVVLMLLAGANTLLVGARKRWHAQPWSRDLAREEISEWHQAAAARPSVVGIRPGSGKGGGVALGVGMLATALVGLGTLLLALPLVAASGVGPVLVGIATPSFSATSRRAAEGEALAPLRPTVDPAITPLAAGEALRSLGRTAEVDLFRPPVREHDRIFGDGELTENPTGLAAFAWSQELVPRLADGLDAATVAYLEELGHHPALVEFATLARAESLDEVGATYVLPLPDTIGLWELPIPRLSGVREAAYAQVGAAVGAAAAGRTEEAESRLRQLIGAGLLLGTDGSTLLTNLIGYVIARTGGEALANLYDATGRPQEAATVRDLLRAGERGAILGRSGSVQASFSELPPVVTSSSAIRGMRWEFLALLSTLGPCANLSRIVFGAPDGHEAWLAEARSSLVRNEADGELFDLARSGWGVSEVDRLQPVVRLFAQMMGSGVESCAALAASAG